MLAPVNMRPEICLDTQVIFVACAWNHGIIVEYCLCAYALVGVVKIAVSGRSTDNPESGFNFLFTSESFQPLQNISTSLPASLPPSIISSHPTSVLFFVLQIITNPSYKKTLQLFFIFKVIVLNHLLAVRTFLPPGFRRFITSDMDIG